MPTKNQQRKTHAQIQEANNKKQPNNQTTQHEEEKTQFFVFVFVFVFKFCDSSCSHKFREPFSLVSATWGAERPRGAEGPRGKKGGLPTPCSSQKPPVPSTTKITTLVPWLGLCFRLREYTVASQRRTLHPSSRTFPSCHPPSNLAEKQSIRRQVET